MSRVARDIGLCVAYGASLPFIPRDIEIPDHYWISTHVQQMLAELAATPPADPAQLTHVTWLYTEFMRHYTVLLKYALIEPLIALAYMIEMTIRWDFHSAAQLGQQNVEAMRQVIVEHEARLERLKPVARTVVEIETMALQLTQGFEADIERSAGAIAILEQQVNDIMEARRSIDLDAVRAAVGKVAVYVQDTLSDPEFVHRLELDDQRITCIEKKLEEAQQRLTRARDKLHRKLDALEQLMIRYGQIGYNRSKHIEELKKRAELLIKKFNTPRDIHVNQFTISVQ